MPDSSDPATQLEHPPQSSSSLQALPSPNNHDSLLDASRLMHSDAGSDGDITLPADTKKHLESIDSSFAAGGISSNDLSASTSDNSSLPGMDDSIIGLRPAKRQQLKQGLRRKVSNIVEESTDDSMTRRLEDLSSPTVAAQARNIQRNASSGLTPAVKTTINGSAENNADDPTTPTAPPPSSDTDLPTPTEIDADFQDPDPDPDRYEFGSLSRAGGSRPRFLRSRLASQRSSISSVNSSFSTGTGSEEDAGYSGGIGRLGLGLNAFSVGGSRAMSRSASLGSIASGVTVLAGGRDEGATHLDALDEGIEDKTPTFEQHNPVDGADAVPLPETSTIESTTHESNPATPKIDVARPAPTDTAIADNIRKINIPESVARSFQTQYPQLQAPNANTMASSPGKKLSKNTGTGMTLKDQSSQIDRLSKENFDLRLKVFFLNEKLEKMSDEGTREMMNENVELKVKIEELKREAKKARKLIRDLEKKITAHESGSTAPPESSFADESRDTFGSEAHVESEEIEYLREVVRTLEAELNERRDDEVRREAEVRRMAEMMQSRNGYHGGDQIHIEEVKEIIADETLRREELEREVQRLKDENLRLRKNELLSGRRGQESAMSSYNSDQTTVVNQLRVDNEELRRELSAQASMLTSRNREKDRLYQEIEDLKVDKALREGRGHMPPPNFDGRSISRPQSAVPTQSGDSIFERSASRMSGAHTSASVPLSEAERDEFENANGALRDQIAELRLSNQDLEQSLRRCLADISEADEQRRELERMIREFESELDRMSLENQALMVERNDALRDKEEVELDFDALKEEAEGEIEIRDLECERLESELERKDEDFLALQGEMRNVSQLLLGLEDSTEVNVGKIHRYEQELASANNEISTLESALADAQHSLTKVTAQYETCQQEVAFLREEQDTDKINLGNLQRQVKTLQDSQQEYIDKIKTLESNLRRERREREEEAGDMKKAQFERKLNERAQDVERAQEEARHLRKTLSGREAEVAEWKGKLSRLESELASALGDIRGTKTSFGNDVRKLRREYDQTCDDVDYLRSEAAEKERTLKERENLMERMALESQKLSESLRKERDGRKSDQRHFESLQSTHTETRRTVTQSESRVSELEKARNRDARQVAALEHQLKADLMERNKILGSVWVRLSTLCGADWQSRNPLPNAPPAPSSSSTTTITAHNAAIEAATSVAAASFVNFTKNILLALKTVESTVTGFKLKCRSVERELMKDYQTLDATLSARTRRLERLESLVKGGVGDSGTLKTENAKLRTENRLVKAELNVMKGENRAAEAAVAVVKKQQKDKMTASDAESSAKSPTPQSPQLARPDLNRSQTVPERTANHHPSLDDVQNPSEKRWILRLRELEKRLKEEREARTMDRTAAQRVVDQGNAEREELKRELERERM